MPGGGSFGDLGAARSAAWCGSFGGCRGLTAGPRQDCGARVDGPRGRGRTDRGARGGRTAGAGVDGPPGRQAAGVDGAWLPGPGGWVGLGWCWPIRG